MFNSRTVFRTVLALTAAAMMTGCGASAMAPLNAPASVFDQAISGKKLKYGLGADLKNRPKIKFDEGGQSENVLEFGAFAALPAKVDMRSQCPPIYNQGTMGSCTGFAIAKGLGEFVLKKQNRHTELSALYLYYMERKAAKQINEDSGASIASGMRILDNLGCAPEKEHPYPSERVWNDKDKMQQYLVMKPDSSDVTAGKSFRVKGLKPINSLRGIRNSLAKGMPVVFGIAIFDNFYSAKNGVIPMPTAKSKFEGGHAVMAVGYDNDKQVLIMRNSWGKEWGDKGYFYLPYDFIRHELAADAWTAKI